MGGSFVCTGGTAGLVAGYGIGSTVDFAGNFNSQYGHVTDGVLHHTYCTNGTPGSGSNIQGLDGHRMKLSEDTNWYGTGGRANWGFASAAASAEHYLVLQE
nr:hypothetical protein [uncultured Chryseobacterium sp.]